jgi:hypothetical protein
MVEGAANAKALGKTAEWTMQSAIDYTLLRHKSKKPFFVKDEQDITILLQSIQLVYQKNETPKEVQEHSYEACIDIMVGTKKEPSNDRKST